MPSTPLKQAPNNQLPAWRVKRVLYAVTQRQASPINHSSHSECCSGNKRLGGLFFPHFVNVTTTNSCFVPASSRVWVWRSSLHNFQSLPWLGPVNCYCLLKRRTNTSSSQLSHWRSTWETEPIQQISRSEETNWESVRDHDSVSLRSARKWGLNAFTYRPDNVRNTFTRLLSDASQKQTKETAIFLETIYECIMGVGIGFKTLTFPKAR